MNIITIDSDTMIMSHYSTIDAIYSFSETIKTLSGKL